MAWATHANYTCHFKFSNGHTKKSKDTNEINFNIFYLADYIQIIILHYVNNNKIMNELFYIFCKLSLENLVCILYLKHISI